MMSEFERFDSYQVLLTKLENEKTSLCQEINDKRVRAEQLTIICSDLRDAIDFEHRLYTSVARKFEPEAHV